MKFENYYDYSNIEDMFDEETILEEAKRIQEKQLKELVKSAQKGLSEEVSEELNRLRTENKKLNEIKNDYNSFLEAKKRMEQKEKELEAYKKEVEKDLIKKYNKETLHSILQKVFTLTDVYTIDTKYIKHPKCNLCDEQRHFHFTTADGREHTVNCACAESYPHNFVTDTSKYKIKSFTLNRKTKELGKADNYNPDESILVSFNTEESDDCFSQTFNIEYDAFVVNTFEEALETCRTKKYGKLFFTSKEEAQKYADYLNEKYKD